MEKIAFVASQNVFKVVQYKTFWTNDYILFTLALGALHATYTIPLASSSDGNETDFTTLSVRGGTWLCQGRKYGGSAP